jgi:hypothetical protein
MSVAPPKGAGRIRMVRTGAGEQRRLPGLRWHLAIEQAASVWVRSKKASRTAAFTLQFKGHFNLFPGLVAVCAVLCDFSVCTAGLFAALRAIIAAP